MVIHHMEEGFMSGIIMFREVAEKILEIRNQKVIVDRDVAALYGVETKEVNQAVTRNPDKFPDGYVISLNKVEKAELVTNCDHLNSLKFSSALPSAFTEKGLYMLATILKSPTATETTIAIVEAFAKLRELSMVINQLPDIQDKTQQKALMEKSGVLLGEIIDETALEVSGTETSVEINLAVMKIKHTVKREKPKKKGEDDS